MDLDPIKIKIHNLMNDSYFFYKILKVSPKQ